MRANWSFDLGKAKSGRMPQVTIGMWRQASPAVEISALHIRL